MNVSICIVTKNPERGVALTVTGSDAFTSVYFLKDGCSIPLFSQVVVYHVIVEPSLMANGCARVRTIVDLSLRDKFPSWCMMGPFGVGAWGQFEMAYRNLNGCNVPSEITLHDIEVVMNSLSDFGRRAMLDCFLPSFDGRRDVWKKFGDDTAFTLPYMAVDFINQLGEAANSPFMWVDPTTRNVHSFSDNSLNHDELILSWCFRGELVLPVTHKMPQVQKWLDNQVDTFGWERSEVAIVEPSTRIILDELCATIEHFTNRECALVCDISAGETFDLTDTQMSVVNHTRTNNVTVFRGCVHSGKTFLAEKMFLMVPKVLIIIKDEVTRLNRHLSKHYQHVTATNRHTPVSYTYDCVILDAAELLTLQELSRVFKFIKRVNPRRIMINYTPPLGPLPHKVWIHHIVSQTHLNVIEGDLIQIQSNRLNLARRVLPLGRIQWTTITTEDISNGVDTRNFSRLYRWSMRVVDVQHILFSIQRMMCSANLLSGTIVYFPDGQQHLADRFNATMGTVISTFFSKDGVRVHDIMRNTQVSLSGCVGCSGVITRANGIKDVQTITLFPGYIYITSRVGRSSKGTKRRRLSSGASMQLRPLGDANIDIDIDAPTKEKFVYTYAQTIGSYTGQVSDVSILVGSCFETSRDLLDRVYKSTNKCVILVDNSGERVCINIKL